MASYDDIPTDRPRWYTIRTVALRLGVSSRTIKKWESAGEIPPAMRQQRGRLSVRVYTEPQIDEIENAVRRNPPQQLRMPIPAKSLGLSVDVSPDEDFGSDAVKVVAVVELENVTLCRIATEFDANWLHLVHGQREWSLPTRPSSQSVAWTLRVLSGSGVRPSPESGGFAIRATADELTQRAFVSRQIFRLFQGVRL